MRNKTSDKSIIFSKKLFKNDRFSIINRDKNFNVVGFTQPKLDKPQTQFASVGLYIFQKNSIARLLFKIKKIGRDFISLEDDILPKLAKDSLLSTITISGDFLDIGVPEDLQRAPGVLHKLIYKPAIFIDRDGTINHDEGYTYKTSDLKLIDGAAEFISFARRKGFYIICISNQGGIALGKFSKKKANNFNLALNENLRLKDANIDMFYFCPHHPMSRNPDYQSCLCRKPGTLLLEKACSEVPIIKERSIFIGDNKTDIQCASNFGIQGHLFNEKNLFNFMKDRI